MKTLHYLLVGAIALFAFVSCRDIDVPYIPQDTYDEAWYAANATISSSDARFSYTEEGDGAISFKTEGGSVVVYVDCGTEWTAENSAADIFGCELQETCITVTADQNLIEEEMYGTITLMTLPSHIHFATIAVTQNAYGAPEITVSTNEWKIPAVAATAEELTTEIGVEANEEWSIESDAEWLTAEKGGDEGNSVFLTATENETFEERVATVVLTCTDGYNSDSETITVTQDARAYITLSAEEFEFDKMGGEDEVTVESNYEWSYAYESDWFTVSESTDGSLTITVNVNTKEDAREGLVTFFAGDRAANVAETTLTITQNAYSSPEITLGETEWHIPAVGEAMTIDITVEATEEWEATTEADWLTVAKTDTGISLTAAQNTETDGRTGEVVVSCTDGVTSVSATVTVTQDGAAYIVLGAEELAFPYSEGNMTVSIESNYDWEFSYAADWLSVSKIEEEESVKISLNENETDYDREALVIFTAGDRAANFAEAVLKISQDQNNPDTTLILEYTITSNNTEIHLPIRNVSIVSVNWGDDSDVETVNSNFPTHTYSNTGTYTVSINGTVKTLAYYSNGVLSGANCLTAVIQWGNTGLTNMECAFRSCTNLASLPKGPGPFENVTTCYRAFGACSSLTTVPEDLFKNCTECTTFEEVFVDCTALTNAPSFEGLSKVTDFSSCFQGCNSLKTLPEGIFSGCTAVTTFSICFFNCFELTDVPEDIFSDCTEATSFYECFLNCSKLTSAPSFKGLSKVTTFYWAFYGCTSLTTVPVNIFSDCTAVTSFNWTFGGCSAVEGESPYDVIDGVKVHLYERENYPDYYTKPTSYSYCFYQSSFSDMDSIPSSWGGNKR